MRVEDRGTATAKFGVDNDVRFIGTDTIYSVRRYDKDMLQYQVQGGDDSASLLWVSEIYLEQAEDKGRSIPFAHGAICL
jgi:hypothetical protein